MTLLEWIAVMLAMPTLLAALLFALMHAMMAGVWLRTRVRNPQDEFPWAWLKCSVLLALLWPFLPEGWGKELAQVGVAFSLIAKTLHLIVARAIGDIGTRVDPEP